MSSPLLPRCPNCGAPWSSRAATTGICSYCGVQLPSVPVPPGAPFPTLPFASPPWSLQVALLLALALLLLLIGAGAVAHARRRPPAQERMLTWHVQEPPILGAFGGKGPVDAIGVYEFMLGQERYTAIDAIDGSTFERRFRIGPLGRDADHVHVALAAGRIVATDAEGHVFVHRATDGRRLFSGKLGGTPTGSCSEPNGAPEVWIEVASGKHRRVRVDTGAIDVAPRPDWCPVLHAACNEFRPRSARCSSPESIANAGIGEGVVPLHVLDLGDLTVVLGATAFNQWVKRATIVGVDRATGKARWRWDSPTLISTDIEPLGPADLIAGKLVVFVPDVTGGNADIVAFDAKTGELLYRQPTRVAMMMPTFALSKDRIAFFGGPPFHTQYLLLRDATTGLELTPSPERANDRP